MVKRYTYDDDALRFLEDKEGEWVKWEDCVNLLQDKIADLQYLKGYINGELNDEITHAVLELEDSERGSYA